MTKSMRISEEEKSFFISSLPYWSSLDVDKEKLFTQNHLICLVENAERQREEEENAERRGKETERQRREKERD